MENEKSKFIWVFIGIVAISSVFSAGFYVVNNLEEIVLGKNYNNQASVSLLDTEAFRGMFKLKPGNRTTIVQPLNQNLAQGDTVLDIKETNEASTVSESSAPTVENKNQKEIDILLSEYEKNNEEINKKIADLKNEFQKEGEVIWRNTELSEETRKEQIIERRDEVNEEIRKLNEEQKVLYDEYNKQLNLLNK